jgi:hypothetical protein
MEPALTMQTATGLLAVSAVGGAIMAAMVFDGKPHPPAWLATLHGFLSVAALSLLIYAFFVIGLPRMAQLALWFFLVAAAAGAFMNLHFHWKMLRLPKSLILIHAGIGIYGFLMLAMTTWGLSHA